MDMSYAVIKTGGKQYRVQQGDVLRVELLAAEEGATVNFDQVLLVGTGESIVVGAPLVDRGNGQCHGAPARSRGQDPHHQIPPPQALQASAGSSGFFFYLLVPVGLAGEAPRRQPASPSAMPLPVTEPRCSPAAPPLLCPPKPKREAVRAQVQRW